MKISTSLLSGFVLLSGWASFGAPKNILFIAVDDLRPELACYGVDGVKTPNLDRLAETGTLFQRAYCQQAVCGASRLSIMGGLYPTRTGEHTYHVEGWRKRHPDLLTMNQHFGKNGYTTVGLGKIYHGTGGAGVDEAGWDRWIKVSAPLYANPADGESAKGYTKNKKKGRKRGPATEVADVDDDFFADGLRTRAASEQLMKLGQAKKPFFLAVGFTKPHLPFVAPKRYWDLYDRSDFSMPENKGIPAGYPEYAANQKAGELRAYTDYKGNSPKDFSKATNQRLLHGYAACVSYMDANVGRVLDTLETAGLAENTIVVFWGDHGWKLGDHSSWVKHTNFECDTRVPLMVRVPGKSQGEATPRLVELIDLYPTLCELTGLPVPEHCQGKSFARLMEDVTRGHRSGAYSVYPAGGKIGHSIRFSKYRYTEWIEEEGAAPVAAVLTDLKADPGEVTNVIDAPAHAEALERAKVLLAERRKNAL